MRLDYALPCAYTGVQDGSEMVLATQSSQPSRETGEKDRTIQHQGTHNQLSNRAKEKKSQGRQNLKSEVGVIRQIRQGDGTPGTVKSLKGEAD